MAGIRLHDFNCGFKAYRQEAVKGLVLPKGYHRFIPALLHTKGFRVTEIPVRHHKRVYGKSKYGAGRLKQGVSDLLKVRKEIRELKKKSV